MSDEFSIFYVLRAIILIAYILGIICFFVFVILFAKSGSKDNPTTRERNTLFFGVVIGLFLTASPRITSNILLDFFSVESFCKFQGGRDQSLQEHCLIYVETNKLSKHRSGEQ